MKQIYAIFIGLLLGTCLASCYDDKGNYDYHWVQDIYTEGMLTDTTVARNGILKKEVDLQKIVLQTETETVTEAANPEDYTYEWKAIARGNYNSLSEDVVLGTKKDLNVLQGHQRRTFSPIRLPSARHGPCTGSRCGKNGRSRWRLSHSHSCSVPWLHHRTRMRPCMGRWRGQPAPR